MRMKATAMGKTASPKIKKTSVVVSTRLNSTSLCWVSQILLIGVAIGLFPEPVLTSMSDMEIYRQLAGWLFRTIKTNLRRALFPILLAAIPVRSSDYYCAHTRFATDLNCCRFPS